MSARLHRMRGASLVTAIFLLVMLATLAVGMVTLMTSQQQSSALDELGTRGYLAARTGAEWGMYQVLQGGGACTAASRTDSFAMPAEGTEPPFTVTVECIRTIDPLPLMTQPRYTVKATACNQPSGTGACPNPQNNADYVQRVVHVEFSAPGTP